MSDILEPALSEALRPEEDADAYWDAVHLVQKRDPGQVWQALQPLAESPRSALRQLVPDALRFLGGTPQPLLEETVTLFRKMLRVENDPHVLSSIAHAFIDLTHSSVIELLLPLTHHESADVRRGAVHGLFQAVEQVAPRLIELAGDPDGDVRNWTLFSLRSIEAPSPHRASIRETFAGALLDSHEEARAEAVLGLAEHHDARALQPTLSALKDRSPWLHYEEAAELLISDGLGADELRQALSNR